MLGTCVKDDDANTRLKRREIQTFKPVVLEDICTIAYYSAAINNDILMFA
ncbi:hypothetical protein LEMLEM_LOCUS10745 [Lemmus lemmus]